MLSYVRRSKTMPMQKKYEKHIVLNLMLFGTTLSCVLN